MTNNPNPTGDKPVVTQALDFIDKFFEPWGSWKTAWWEGEVSDDAALSADNALKHVANLLRRHREQDTLSREGRTVTFVRCKNCGGEFDEGEWDADTRCPECESPKQADGKRRAALSPPASEGRDVGREAIERFIADYDDGDRADAGVHPLMEAHIADFRAALSTAPASPEHHGEQQ